jgi:hypothetical protein
MGGEMLSVEKLMERQKEAARKGLERAESLLESEDPLDKQYGAMLKDYYTPKYDDFVDELIRKTNLEMDIDFVNTVRRLRDAGQDVSNFLAH